MSRLESMMRRLSAQRDGLNWGVGEIDGVSGDVLEMGLGNGRTYDHLRQLLPNKRIWVIDRALKCHPSCVPPEENALLGEADEMLDDLHEKGVRIALLHYDFGVGDDARDVAESMGLSAAIARLMSPGGIVISGQPMTGMTKIRGPATIQTDRYFFYRAT